MVLNNLPLHRVCFPFYRALFIRIPFYNLALRQLRHIHVNIPVQVHSSRDNLGLLLFHRICFMGLRGRLVGGPSSAHDLRAMGVPPSTDGASHGFLVPLPRWPSPSLHFEPLPSSLRLFITRCSEPTPSCTFVISLGPSPT